jgi:hypothetical protein
MRIEPIKICWNQILIKTEDSVLEKIDEVDKKVKKGVFQVRVCPTCNMAWERIKTFDVKSTLWSHIVNFPKYGLTKKICPDCND